MTQDECNCEFDPYPDDDEESWHYKRTCKDCGETWFALKYVLGLLEPPQPKTVEEVVRQELHNAAVFEFISQPEEQVELLKNITQALGKTGLLKESASE